MLHLRTAAALVVVLFAPWAAHAQNPVAFAVPEADPVDFAKDVHPILRENCFECHGSGNRKGGFQMNTREQLLEGSPSGKVVIPGKPEESLLIELVREQDPDFRMPPKGRPLTDVEITTLWNWIEQGVPWSEEVQAETGYVAPLKLHKISVPEEADPSGNLIDDFITAYFEEHDTAEPAVVDDRRFARRAYLDIIGLLPPPGQLQEFLNAEGKRQARRTDLVRKLLENDRGYAEHWMSFWNDHLRNDFVGTGYIDGGRKQITDWLFNALETNKPYDEFVEQLVDPNPFSEGFINGIVWRGDNAAVQKPSMQAARNVSQVFMGVNLKCASCHDSFVDDWKLKDAYGLANCFSKDPMELVRCEAPTGEMAGYKFLWPGLGSIDGSADLRERRGQVASLVTDQENGYFARTIVNRFWARLMGRGLVEPLDTIANEPWHPELIDALARAFIANDYNLRWLTETIATSKAYQYESVRRNVRKAEDYVFKGPGVRRMTAEQFYDALSTLSGVWQTDPKFIFPENRNKDYEKKQAELAKAAAGGRSHETAGALSADTRRVRAWRVPADPLMRALGRTNREQVVTRREHVPTTLQALELSNGETLARFLRRGAENLLADASPDAETLVTTLYRQALQRKPTEQEQTAAQSLLGAPVTAEGLEDLLWALAMLPEFQMIY